MKTLTKSIILSALVGMSFGLTSCNSDSVTLSGAGATFPAPFYIEATKQYADLTGTNVSYGGVGSGAGIRNLTEISVDFAGSDVFLSDEEMAKMPAPVLHIPTCIGGVAMAYNLKDVAELNLTPALVSEIYQGVITNWNDPKIAAVNPGVTFPDQAITVVYRSDGSGTTAVFSGYMSEVDSVWKEKIGAGKNINLPVGIAAKGNPGVAGVIAETVGSIGYIGSEYSLSLDIPAAKMQNSAGNFVTADINTIALSAQMDTFADDTRVILANSSNADAYPISTFTWLLVYKEQNYNNRTLAQAQALQKFLLFMVGADAAESAKKTHYAPLPDLARQKAEAVIKSMTYDGKPIPAAEEATK